MNQAGQFDNCNKVRAVTIENVIWHENSYPYQSLQQSEDIT